MGCPAQCILGENLVFTVQARDGTGAPCDATGDVSYSVYEDETSTAILTGTMAKLAAQTGFYSEQIACTTANGFERYKSYTVRISATVATVSVAKTYTFICLGVEDAPQATSGALTSLANFKSYIGETGTDYDTIISALITRATSAIEAHCDRVLRSANYREFYDGDGTTELYLKQYPVTQIDLLSTSLTDVITIKNTTSGVYYAHVEVKEDSSNPESESLLLYKRTGTPYIGTSDTLTLADYYLSTLVTAINALSGWEANLLRTDLADWGAWELIPKTGLECYDSYAYLQIPYEPEYNFQLHGQTVSPYKNNTGLVYLPTSFSNGHQNITVKYTAGYTTTPADLEQICIDLVKIYFDGRNKDLALQSEKLGDHSYSIAGDARDLPANIAKRLAPYKRWSV